MLNFFSKKKKSSTTNNKPYIEKEIAELTQEKDKFLLKTKEYDSEFCINIFINKQTIGIDIDKEKSKIPDYITLMMIIDMSYPERAPKILSKTNFTTPSLMDGRDLLYEICPNWNPKVKLIDVANLMTPFLARVLNSKGYKFYGTFHLGAVYDMKNFENMLVNNFTCKLELTSPNDKKTIPGGLNPKGDFTLILSGDALILFEKMDSGNGKIVFWSSLYAITDLQINKMQKIVSINFYDEDSTTESHLKLYIENILFFRDTLVKKMNGLKIKSESIKLIKGQKQSKRLSAKEINTMTNINLIESNAQELKQRIEKGEINDYTVNTLSTLCGKAIEYYGNIGNERHKVFLEMMQTVLSMEGVKKLTEDDQKEMQGAPDS